MAAASPAATDERSNFVRLTRLLISTGTKVVRELLDFIIPPANLTVTLRSPAVYTRLQQMKRTRLLTQPQWSLLFPSLGTCGNSKSFDITLLFKLLREFCGLTAPATTGWDKLPNSTDLTLTADLARIKHFRNTLYGHVNEEMQLSDDEFKDYWQEIKDALLRIVAHYDPSKVSYWSRVINDLLTSPLTDDDRRNIEELKAWYLDEKQVIEVVEKLSRQVQNLEEKVNVLVQQDEEAKSSPEQQMDQWREGNLYPGDKPVVIVTYNITVKDSAQVAVGNKAQVVNIESASDKCEDKDVCTRVQEYTKKLKLSIKKQTDFQPRMRKKKKIRTDDIFTNVTIQRGQKRFKKDQAERLDRKEFDEFKASITTLKNCSEMFICPENDDPKSTATVKTNPKSILLIGKAGIGKTLFCQKLVRDWANDSLFEKEEKSKAPIFEFTVLLTFRQLNLLREEKLGLHDVLSCSSLLDGQSIIDEALLQYIIENPEKLLLIIDGYDEYNYRDKITSDFETRYPNNPSKEIPVPAMIAKLLKGKILQDSVVLISTRPGEAEAVGEMTFDATVEITGFSSPQVMKYVENYFQENESLKNAVLDHIKANDFFVSFGEIPVMCFLMCYYMEWHVTESRTATTLPVTRTNLYHEAIKVFIKKHHVDSKYREMTETEIQETLLKLAELAFNLTREKKYIFEEEDMKKLNLSEREITKLKASGLLDCCPGVKTSPFDEPTLQYVFTHLTIQEYLCAVRCVETKQIPDEEETSGVTLIFMAGLLSRNKDENLMKKLVKKIEPRDDRDYINKLLVLNVLHEYGDVELSKLIIDNLYHKYCGSDGGIVFEDVTLSYLDCVCISYLLNVIKLTNTHLTSHKHSVNTLYISYSSLSSSCVQVLCQSLVLHHYITKLWLLWCELDDKCVNVIANYLLSTKITHLILMGNNITDVGVKCVCDVLIKDHCCVEWLDLRGNYKITVECKEYHRNLVQKRKPRVKFYI